MMPCISLYPPMINYRDGSGLFLLAATFRPGQQMQVKSLQFLRHLLHKLILLIVALGIGPHQPHIRMELIRHLVNPRLQLELDCLEVDRSADGLVVPWSAITDLVYGLEEGQDLLLGFQTTEDGTLPVEFLRRVSKASAGGFGLELLGEVLQLFGFLDGGLEDLTLGKRWSGLGWEGQVFLGFFLRGSYHRLSIRLFLVQVRRRVFVELLFDLCWLVWRHFQFYRNYLNFHFFRTLSQSFLQTHLKPLFFRHLILSLHSKLLLLFSSRLISPSILQTILP